MGSQSGLGCGEAAETQGVGEEGAEDKEEDEQEVEEGRKVKGMSSPQMVSRREREEHELTHLPYRPWRPHCARGRGRNMPHKKVKHQHDTEIMILRVALEYFS